MRRRITAPFTRRKTDDVSHRRVLSEHLEEGAADGWRYSSASRVAIWPAPTVIPPGSMNRIASQEPMETEEILSFVKRTGGEECDGDRESPCSSLGLSAAPGTDRGRLSCGGGDQACSVESGSLSGVSTRGVASPWTINSPRQRDEAVPTPNLALLRRRPHPEAGPAAAKSAAGEGTRRTGVTGEDARIYISPVFGQLSPEIVGIHEEGKNEPELRLQLPGF